jgi:hypothetical protein
MVQVAMLATNCRLGQTKFQFWPPVCSTESVQMLILDAICSKPISDSLTPPLRQ